VFSLHSAMFSLLTLQPHASGLQLRTSRQTKPFEVTTGAVAVETVHPNDVALTAVPESSAVHCTVFSVLSIVVAVIGGEHRGEHVREAEIIACVTRVLRRPHHVVVCLSLHYERTVLGPVPVAGVAT